LPTQNFVSGKPMAEGVPFAKSASKVVSVNTGD